MAEADAWSDQLRMLDPRAHGSASLSKYTIAVAVVYGDVYLGVQQNFRRIR